MIIINATEKKRIDLGRRGEDRARKIVFDITGWAFMYGKGEARVVAQRDKDLKPYPVEVTQDINTVTWEVTPVDNDQPGYGKCELIYVTEDERVAKSVIFQTYTEVSLSDPVSPPDSPNIYGHLEKRIGNLANLCTNAKNSLVEAINDLHDIIMGKVKESYLSLKGGKLIGKLFTRDVYVGGAFDAYGNWGPRNPNIVDHTPLYESVMNGVYISTMQVKEGGRYYLIFPEGSNYLYKLEITQRNASGGSSTIFFDVDKMPVIAAGDYSDRDYYDVGNGIYVIFSNNTKVENNSKTFNDGFAGKKRINFQKKTVYEDDNPDYPYPAIEFSTNGPAEVTIWWVAGGDSRFFAIQSEKGSGSSRLEVSGTFVAHGSAEVKNTLTTRHLKVEEKAEVGGDLNVGSDISADGTVKVGNDLLVSGFIDCGESLEMNMNDIKRVQSIEVYGTAELRNDVKIKNNTSRDYTIKLGDVLNEALDYDFKNRVYVNEMPGADFTAKLQEAINIVDNGGVVCIPSGEYPVSSGRYIPLNKSVRFLGVGKTKPVILFKKTGSLIEVASTLDGSVIFENLAFRQDDGLSCGVVAFRSTQPSVEFIKCDLEVSWRYNISYSQPNGQQMQFYPDKLVVKNSIMYTDNLYANDEVRIIGSKIYHGSASWFYTQDTVKYLELIDSYFETAGSIAYLSTPTSVINILVVNCTLSNPALPLLWSYRTKYANLIAIGGTLGFVIQQATATSSLDEEQPDETT